MTEEQGVANAIWASLNSPYAKGNDRRLYSAVCDYCGDVAFTRQGPNTRHLKNSQDKFSCSNRCSMLALHQSGSGNFAWKGGRTFDAKGYVRVFANGHPDAQKANRLMEHRAVMSKSIGRRLTKDEVVHHINEDKSDNRIENLELMTKKEHGRHHMMLQRAAGRI